MPIIRPSIHLVNIYVLSYDEITWINQHAGVCCCISAQHILLDVRINVLSLLILHEIGLPNLENLWKECGGDE